jgi:hypothetical protein
LTKTLLAGVGENKNTRKPFCSASRVRFSFIPSANGSLRRYKVFAGSLRGAFYKKRPSKNQKIKKSKNQKTKISKAQLLHTDVLAR